MKLNVLNKTHIPFSHLLPRDHSRDAEKHIMFLKKKKIMSSQEDPDSSRCMLRYADFISPLFN